MASLRTPPQHPCYSEKKNFHWIHGFLGYNKEPSLEENRAKNRSEEATSSFHLGPGWKSSTKFHGERHKWLVSHLPFNKMQKMQQTVSSPGSLPIQKKMQQTSHPKIKATNFSLPKWTKKTGHCWVSGPLSLTRKAPNFDVQFFFQIVAWCFELATCCRDDDSQKVLLMKRWWIIYSETCPSYYKTFA